MTNEANGRVWLLISASTAGGAATLRVQVWRKLRSLGALYLQQSVCLLPARPAVVREVRRLADRIRRQGGTVRVLSMTFADSADEHAVIAELNAARDAEYAELLERLPELRKELADEHARGNVTYAEVEESEADLERFRTWLAKIAARDYFVAPGGQAARDAVEEAAAELAAFEDAALRAEAPEPAPAGGMPGLRVVGPAMTGSFWWDLLLGMAAALLLAWLALVIGLVIARPRGGLLREALRLLPDVLRLVRRLATDPTLPRGVRIRLGLLLAYLACPIDLIPDFIPVLGYADDAIIVTAVLRGVVRRAGIDAVRAHWPGTDDGFAAIARLTGLDRVTPGGCATPRLLSG